MSAKGLDDWTWADGDAMKSVARIFLLLFSASLVVSGAVLIVAYVLPWWVTMPPLGYGLARIVWWTIR